MLNYEFLDILKSVDIEDITDSAEKTATTGGLKQGVNKSKRVILSDDKEYILKLGRDEHISKWRLVPKNELYKREVVAFKIDKILGWDIVPFTKLVKVDGNPGSAQEWIDEAVHIKNIDEFVDNLDDTNLWKFGLFDLIIANDDRHSGNVLWDKEQKEPVAIDNGYSMPFTSSAKNPRSLILSRFAVKIKDNEIPTNFLEDLKKLYFSLDSSQISEILDEPSYLEFISRLEELITKKRANLENYRIIPKLLEIPHEVDLEQLDIYSWVDEILNKAKFKIEGKLLYGTKNLGYQIVYDSYNSLKEAIDKYFKTITPGTNENIIVDGLIQTLENWQKEINIKLQVPIEELFRRGFAAGIIDTGISKDLDLVDKLALEFIVKHPDGILETLKTFSNEIRLRFKEIIADHFKDPEKVLSIFGLTSDLGKEVASEKWKFMRIARTETNKIVNSGRITGWSKDPYKNEYYYNWDAAADNRTKQVSYWRMNNGPYSWEEICFLWEHQKQLMSDNTWENDIYNNRCSASRYPAHKEVKGNRFSGQLNMFEKVFDLGFEYE